MAQGHREKERQESLFVATSGLLRSTGHAFYEKLNQLLAEAGFDDFVEAKCRPYYAEKGRPSIAPGVYFRMLMVGYFEDISSQRGIAWRCADSLSLREFLGLTLEEPTPDHSTLTRTRQRLPLEVSTEIFRFVLEIANNKKLLSGKSIGIDGTLLEADAAMKSIVRKDTNEEYKEYLKRLLKEEGNDDPSDDDIRRFDKDRPGKGANKEWESSTDPDAQIMRMKDGSTHLAYKAEHAVDVDSELIVAAQIHPGAAGDTETLPETLYRAMDHLHEVTGDPRVQEVAADKGYHSNETLAFIHLFGSDSYVSVPDQPRNFAGKPGAFRTAYAANVSRTLSERGTHLRKKRGEVVERTFARLCETGGCRRTRLRRLVNVRKRYLISAAAYNLGVLMRKLFGVGAPRSLQGRVRALFLHLQRLLGEFQRLLGALKAAVPDFFAPLPTFSPAN